LAAAKKRRKKSEKRRENPSPREKRIATSDDAASAEGEEKEKGLKGGPPRGALPASILYPNRGGGGLKNCCFHLGGKKHIFVRDDHVEGERERGD